MKFNQYTCSGRLTRDFETKVFTQGGGLAKATVVVDNSYKKDGQWVDDPLFLDLIFFYKTDGMASKVINLAKGDNVLVNGKLKQETWEDKRNGEKRSKMVLIVDSIQKYERAGKAPSAASQESQGGADEDNDIPF